MAGLWILLACSIAVAFILVGIWKVLAKGAKKVASTKAFQAGKRSLSRRASSLRNSMRSRSCSGSRLDGMHGAPSANQSEAGNGSVHDLKPDLKGALDGPEARGPALI